MYISLWGTTSTRAWDPKLPFKTDVCNAVENCQWVSIGKRAVVGRKPAAIYYITYNRALYYLHWSHRYHLHLNNHREPRKALNSVSRLSKHRY